MRYNTEYRTLFKLSFQHSFYDKKAYAKMDAIPMPATRRLFDRYDLGMRMTGNELLVYYKSEESKKVSLEHMKEAIMLSFVLVPSDKNFWLMTNVYQLSLGEHYIFSNLDPLLSKQEGEFVPELKLSDVEPSKFLTPGKGLEPYLRDLADGVVAKNPFGEEVSAENQEETNHSAMFEEFSDRCDWMYIEENNSQIYVSPFEVPAAALGVFSFGLNPADEQTSFETLKGTEYRIEFEGREVFWRYHIVSRKKSDLRDYSIKNGKVMNLFDQGEEVVLLNGQDAYLLTSLEPIRLKQTYDGGYRLEVTKYEPGLNDEGQLLRYKLPTPELDKVKIQREENTEKAYSDIYLYI